jgi:L-iditol 2-dehydrogenase
MKALMRMSIAPNDVQLVDIPEPRPQRDEVKIQVKYGGICGSDLKMLNENADGSRRIRPPVVLGHEGAGIVVEVGDDVHSIRPGDVVSAETTMYACKKCRYCINAEYNMCPDRIGLGSGANGYFAEYVIAKARGVHKIPEGVGLKAAALLEPLSCAVHMVFRQARILPDDIVVVMGPGAIGSCVAQVVKASGARPILVGTGHSSHRLDISQALGIETLSIDDCDVVSYVMDVTKGIGADLSFECVGSRPALANALDCLRKGGTLVLGAAPTEEVIFDIPKAFFGQIKIVGSLSTTPFSWYHSICLLQQDKLNLEPLATHVVPLEQWEQGFDYTKERRGLKILLEPQTVR